jgi:uncharacterized protein
MKISIFISFLICFSAFNSNGQSLIEAIAKKDTVLVAKLIKEGANPNEKDANGTTPLMQVCRFPDLPVARLLLGHGATVNEPRSPKGRTPLMVACAYWSGLNMVKLLVENGAAINARSQDSSTALMFAASFEKLDVVNYLLEHGADADAKNTPGKTALDLSKEGKEDDYLKTSIKDTRFDKEKTIASLEKAMKKI